MFIKRKQDLIKKSKLEEATNVENENKDEKKEKESKSTTSKDEQRISMENENKDQGKKETKSEVAIEVVKSAQVDKFIFLFIHLSAQHVVLMVAITELYMCML